MQFVDLLDKYGLPLTVIAVLAWFLFRHFWPWLKEQINRWQTERAAEQQQFITSLQSLTRIADTQHALHQEHEKAIIEQMQHMANAIAEVAIVVRELYRQPHTHHRSRKPRNPRRLN